MALKRNENKLKFGLKRVAFALATIAEDGSATYGDVVSFPGARTLSMEPQGAGEPWNADDGVYYSNTAPTSRQGDLEMARYIDAFKRMILGYIADANGILVEDMSPAEVHFALLFETMNDRRPRRYVMYNCTATAPAVGSATNEGNKDPQTETSTITSMGIYVASHGKWFDHGETTPDTDPEAYANWFKVVQLPGPPPDPYPVKTVTGSPVVITDGAEDMAVEAMFVAIHPMQSGSGDPSPDNIRTISGYNHCAISVHGKNLYDDTKNVTGHLNRSDGTVVEDSSDTTQVTEYIEVDGDFLITGHIFSMYDTSGIETVNVCIYDKNKEFVRYTLVYFDQSGDGSAVISIEDGEKYVRYIITSKNINNNNYRFYSARIYSVSWYSYAGTVYGGTLDVTTGLLTVDMAVKTVTAPTNIRRNNATQYYILESEFPGIRTITGQQASIISDKFIATDQTSLPGGVFQNNANVRINTINSYDSAAAMLEDVGDIQICYPLAEPVTYQLAATEVQTLLGDNTISANCGDVTVSYHSDPTFQEE